MNQVPQPPPSGVPDVLDYEGLHLPKPWKVGTLSYTTAGLVVLFAWLLWGDFAWAMKDRTVTDVLTLLIKKFDISDTLTALLLVIIPQLLVILIQPIVSFKSDRHRGRWGRRIPFLLAPTPFAVLSMVGLAFCPLLGSMLSHGTGFTAPAGNLFTVTTADGTVRNVSLLNARTFQDIVDRINKAGTDKFAAKYFAATKSAESPKSADDNRLARSILELSDETKGPGILTVTPLGGLTTAADLGLTTPSSGGKITGAIALPIVDSINRLDHSTLLFYAIFWITFEVATTVADSVYRAFVNDVVPRPVLGRFYGLFRALSLIAGMIFNHWFFKQANDHYIAIFVGIGLVYGVGFAIMCLKVKEGKYPPPPEMPKPTPQPGHSAHHGPAAELAATEKVLILSRFDAIKGYFHDCFTKPYYLMVFAAIVLPGIAFIPINTFNYYFAKSIGMSDGNFGDLKAFYFSLSLLQTVPLGWLVDKFHPLRVSIIAVILHGAASLWGAFFIHGTTSFAIAYVATGTLSGSWFTATASMALMLMPKLKFAQYYSAMAAIQSVLVIIFNIGMGKVLDLSHHQYRLTYLFGGVFDTMGLIATIMVFRMFLKLGGTKGYVAP